MKGLKLPVEMAISTPPTAAKIAPSTKVKEITRLVSIPNRFAICRSCAQARQARPIREFLMNTVSPIIKAIVEARINKRE